MARLLALHLENRRIELDTYERQRQMLDEMKTRDADRCLSFDEIPQDIVPFRAEQWSMPWRHAFVEGGFQNPLAKDFDVSGIPKPILVDPEGKIVALGEQLMGDDLEGTLAEILDSEGEK